MGNWVDFLAGTNILEKRHSKINGNLTVVKDLAWGTHIQAGGVTQSGGVAETVWRTSLRTIVNSRLSIDDCLILGLGGGSIAKLVRKNWPKCHITGVEIDPIMVDLGKKYLNLDKYKVDIKIIDAQKFCHQPSAISYQLICIDMYIGNDVPKKFEQLEFIKEVEGMLANDGMTIFNRLYYGPKRASAIKFQQKLESVFGRVEPIYPEANVMFVCSR